MNKIQNEKQLSEQQFDFDLIDGTKYVDITVRNVALAEAMVRNDSSYIKESFIIAPENSKRKGAYGGSIKYWVGKIKEMLDDKKIEESWEDIIRGLVIAIDRSNSTHLNSDGVGIEQITDRICKIDKNKLVEMIKKPKENDYELIKIITEKTVVPVDDKNHHARTNYSFATKFCRALCMTLFEGEEEQDNFSIYDSVVAEAIWYYIKYYKIKATKADLKDYAKFINIIDYIIEKSDKNVSRNGFDHLIWYYYKGRPKSYFNM